MPTTSRLETLPRDIIQHIAFLSASETPFDSLDAILNLLQSCSTVHDTLSLSAAPDLYAHIFGVKFDTVAPSRRYDKKLTDSALAGELANRCRLLVRVKHIDFSFAGLLQDLWTALWMFLENEELNAQQLSAVNFTDYILGLKRTVLGPHQAQVTSDPRTDSTHLKHITVWLLCLSLPRRVILDMSKQDRDELYGAIFPFIFIANKVHTLLSSESGFPSLSVLDCPSGHGRAPIGPSDAHGGDPSAPRDASASSSAQAVVSAYNKSSFPVVPDPSTAAINIACAYCEATPMQVPPHLLSARRAAVTGNQLFGPTQEHYSIVVSYQTLLLADCVQAGPRTLCTSIALNSPRTATRSARYDLQFHDTLQLSGGAPAGNGFRYVPGTLSALWEGVYRVLNVPATVTTNSEKEAARGPMSLHSFTKPMQFQITEYVSNLDDNESQPTFNESDILNHDFFADSLNISYQELVVGGRVYRKFQPPLEPGRHATPKFHPLYDVILLGEALDDHSRAWGRYTFSGRVLSDGRIVLKREAKDASVHQSDGVWIFVGRLQSQALILGRWRIAGAPESAVLDHGVFSMGRVRQ